MTRDSLISAEFLCVGLGTLLLLLFVTGVLFAVWRSGKRAAWDRSGRAYPICPRCRYPMRGLSRAQCPECGTRYTLDQLWTGQRDVGD